jgi:hypothetical protein
MRARRVGTKSEFRLFQDEREIGHVDVASVSFRGFESRDDAALATWAAQRALTRRRRSMPHRMDYHEGFLIMDHGGTPTVVARAGVLATLLAPAAEKSEIDGWGCEMQLLPEEQFEVFCEGTSYGDMARAAEDGGVPGHTPVPTETPASDPPAGGGCLFTSRSGFGEFAAAEASSRRPVTLGASSAHGACRACEASDYALLKRGQASYLDPVRFGGR